jgi:surfactin synthase thioesterase subunit
MSKKLVCLPYAGSGTGIYRPWTHMGGESDEVITSDDLRDWAAHASHSFRWQETTGGHMYLTEAWPQRWKSIEEAVR